VVGGAIAFAASSASRAVSNAGGADVNAVCFEQVKVVLFVATARRFEECFPYCELAAEPPEERRESHTKQHPFDRGKDQIP
jgi:hypothetical protein